MKHVALIACGKTKASEASPARDLYQGGLFRKSLRYAHYDVPMEGLQFGQQLQFLKKALDRE